MILEWRLWWILYLRILLNIFAPRLFLIDHFVLMQKPSTSGNVHKLVMNAKSFISFDAFEEFTHDKVMDEQVKLNKALNIDANNAMVESMVQISTRKTWNSLINKEISNPKTSAKKLVRVPLFSYKFQTIFNHCICRL